MKTVDRRLNRMIEIADELEIQLDKVVAHMGRCSSRRFRVLSSDPSQLLALAVPGLDALKSEVSPKSCTPWQGTATQ